MIFVTFEQEGIHNYPQALNDPRLADVSFLGHPHRHIFKFKVAIEVFHSDRDIEFILFKRELQQRYQNPILSSYKSCEMMADDLHSYISSKYPVRDMIIEVSEDGENGAICTYKKD